MSQTLASGLLKIEADAFQNRLPSEQSAGSMDIYLKVSIQLSWEKEEKERRRGRREEEKERWRH